MTSIQPSIPPVAQALPADDAVLVSVVIPCLNEEQNVERCVQLSLRVLEESGIPGEVVVADNASEDRSAELAAAAGARVVTESRRGYGSAYPAGFGAAPRPYIRLARADPAYPLHQIPHFLSRRAAGGGPPPGDPPDKN